MNIILLSGGAGERLWPVSNDIQPKQFMKVFKDDNGNYESMIQRMYKQICCDDPGVTITIATSKNQVSAIRKQLGYDIDICVEPCKKDTFPAIILAAVYLHEIKKKENDEIIVVCPVDSYVGKEYFSAIRTLTELAHNSQKNLTLMGIEPTSPSEKYGYIIPENKDVVSKVSMFKEKPDRITAERYLLEGALWNSGVFAFRLGYAIDKAHEIIDFKDYKDILSKYNTLEKISFDYAVVEQEKEIQVMRFQGQWRDLGTWNTLTDLMEEKLIGNAVMDEECHNVHIINESDIPVLCMGMENVVIAVSKDGILVSDKEKTECIRTYINQLKENESKNRRDNSLF